MAVNVPGLISVIVFYVLILVIGIWAGRKSTKSGNLAEIFLANRNMGLIVSLFTITASWLGGGFINGTAEMIAQQGLVWTQAPFGFSASLVLCGIFFCPKMRRANYVTMFDPFQDKYGQKIGALMCIPQFFADLFWSAAILSALGATIHIILDLDENLSIILSAVITVIYTFLGGLRSVAYTDVIQLLCVTIGLTIACPFTMTNPAVDLDRIQDRWQGSLQSSHVASYLDTYCLIILGGTTWQEYYQRVLACKSAEQARVASIFAGALCFLLSIPAAVIGVAGAAADWNATTYEGEIPLPAAEMSLILPLSLHHLCPLPVSVIGLGAISAAVMSSTDSSVLVTASVFTKNIYKSLIRTKASEREMIWVMRGAIVVAGAMATVLAIVSKTVYGLFVLSADLMYVILFPQFVSVLFVKTTNSYGALLGFIFGFIMRVGAGEPLVELPTFIHFPFYNETDGQLFPFRTFISAVTFVILYVVSLATHALFERKVLPVKYDFLKCMKQRRKEEDLSAERRLVTKAVFQKVEVKFEEIKDINNTETDHIS